MAGTLLFKVGVKAQATALKCGWPIIGLHLMWLLILARKERVDASAPAITSLQVQRQHRHVKRFENNSFISQT